MKPLTLPQRLTLAEFLGKHFGALRKETLNPEAADEMTVGERLAVKFGGQVAAWVSMPNPASRAVITDEPAFRAWVKKHLPAEVERVEQVRPATAKALTDAVKAQGGWLNTETGEIVPVPGVEVKTGEPSPRVELGEAAGEAIGGAWRAGDIDLGAMLALPAADGEAA